MAKDTQITDVVFRVFRKEILAMFPHEVCDSKGHVTSYMHIGQHGGADYSGCIRSSRKAIESEYADLKKEMEGLGYNLKVVNKQNYNLYLKSYKEVNRIK